MDNNDIIGSKNSPTVMGPADCNNKQTNEGLMVVNIQVGGPETLSRRVKRSSNHSRGRMDRTNYSERTNKQNSEGKCLPHQAMPLAAISVQSEYGQINSGSFVHPDPPLSQFSYSSKYARGKMNRTNQSNINKSVEEQTSISDKNQYPSSSDRKACNKGPGHLRTTKDTMDAQTNKQANRCNKCTIRVWPD